MILGSPTSETRKGRCRSSLNKNPTREKKRRAATRTLRTDEQWRANLRVDRESTAGVCSRVTRSTQISRTDLMFPAPGGFFVCLFFLFLSLVSPCCCCRCCCCRRLSILENNYAQRVKEEKNSRGFNLKSLFLFRSPRSLTRQVRRRAEEVKV